jgi:AraC-like DNA-binding protein
MDITAYPPTELLRPFVKTYLIIESRNELGDLVNTVIPDTSIVMAFRYKGGINYITDKNRGTTPSSSLSGLIKSARLFNYAKGTGNILVIFKEGMAAAFLKEPLQGIFEEIVSLDYFFGKQVSSIIEEQLAESTNNEQRIALIERFLLTRLHHKPDKLISIALQKIHLAKGLIKIKDLAAMLYISQDALEKRFRQTVGTSPKQFSSIVRMRAIINSNSQSEKLPKIVLDAGYYDQPHFNKDFKLFTGQTPTDFFKSGSFLQINDFLQ